MATSIDPTATSTEPTVPSTETTSTSIGPAVISGYTGTISCPSGYAENHEGLRAEGDLGDAKTPEEAARDFADVIRTSQDLSSATYDVTAVDSHPGVLEVWVSTSDGVTVGFMLVGEYPEAGVFLSRYAEICSTVAPPDTES